MMHKLDARDYLAAHLIPALWTEYQNHLNRGNACDENWRESLAWEAYQMADIMLNIRSARLADDKNG